jgi:hypothetical protein
MLFFVWIILLKCYISAEKHRVQIGAGFYDGGDKSSKVDYVYTRALVN